MVKLHPFECAECGSTGHKRRGCINRSLAKGAPLYCGPVCAGLGRREHRSADLDALTEADYQARRRVLNAAMKAAYDKAYRAKNAERIKAGKAARYRANAKDIYQRRRAWLLADPEAMRRHRETQDRCQSTPEWKAHKRQYDRRYRAVRQFGPEWAPVAVLTLQIEDLVRELEPVPHRLESAKGTLNKRQARRRKWDAKQKRKPSAQ